MQKLIILLTVSLFFYSCKKATDSIETQPGSCDSVIYSFTADVKPLLVTYCLTGSNCHSTGSLNSGGDLTDYEKVLNKKAAIRRNIELGIMPVNAVLSAEQIKVFVCWIDSGAPNN